MPRGLRVEYTLIQNSAVLTKVAIIQFSRRLIEIKTLYGLNIIVDPCANHVALEVSGIQHVLVDRRSEET